MGDECADDGQRWTAWLASALAVVLGAVLTPTVASAGPGDTAPLEIVAVDVTAFPRVVFDVALPEMELPADVDPGMFAVPGATDVVAEALDPADLTLGLVLDDGPQVSLDAVAAEQGSATELVRNLPDGVEVVISTTVAWWPDQLPTAPSCSPPSLRCGHIRCRRAPTSARRSSMPPPDWRQRPIRGVRWSC